MNYSPTSSILARHLDSPQQRHRLVAIDFETLRCLDCCHTLLLKPNREVLDQAAAASQSAPIAAQPDPDVDKSGRRRCPRCSKWVTHMRVDVGFEPVPHGHAETRQPCLASGTR